MMAAIKESWKLSSISVKVPIFLLAIPNYYLKNLTLDTIFEMQHAAEISSGNSALKVL